MQKPKAIITLVLIMMLVLAVIRPTYSWLKVESSVSPDTPGEVGVHSGTIDIQVDTGSVAVDTELWALDLSRFVPDQGKQEASALFSPFESGSSVFSAVARNNSNMDSVVRLNLKGIPTSGSYGDMPNDFQSVLLQVRRLKGWDVNPVEATSGWLTLKRTPQGNIWAPDHDALAQSGFAPGNLAKNDSYDYTLFYDEYLTNDLPMLGLDSKAFLAVASIEEDGSLSFGLPDSFMALGEDGGAGDDFLYAYLPPKSALVYSRALSKIRGFFDNSLQYAMFSMPLTLYVEDSYSEEKSPLIAAYGVQANQEAVDTFFGQGIYDALEEAIIPPELRK
ncbi:MAG: hypothetical protein LBT59_02465 [Clostridiales bacterium]|jgi:hypothetical protein|nr:hypothetical protein [Clostridiales bacterium]